MNTIRRFYFPERNRIFLALTALLIPMVFLMVKYSDAPLLLPEKWFGFLLCDPNADKTMYNIAISYAAAYIFYIVQVYISTNSKEKRALLLVYRSLSNIIREIKEILYIVDQMIEFSENGTATIKHVECFYKMEYFDKYSQLAEKVTLDKKKQSRQKSASSCKNVSELCKKLDEAGEHYQKLLNIPTLANLDRYTYELIINLDVSKFCNGIKNTIHVMQHLQPLRDALSEAQTKANVQQVQEFLKDYPDFHIEHEAGRYWILGPNNIKIDLPHNMYKDLPLKTDLQNRQYEMTPHL